MSYKDEIIRLRGEGKSYNEISDELGCAKSTVSFHCKKNGLGSFNKSKLTDEDKELMNVFYQTHTLNETTKKFNVSEGTVKRYCAKNKRSNLTPEEKKKKRSEAVKKRRDKVKIMSIEYMGSKCECCGYDKCNSALEFHHKDPNKKDFGISSKGYTRSWEKVKEELDKCIMVCSNCHREIHAGLIVI